MRSLVYAITKTILVLLIVVTFGQFWSNTLYLKQSASALRHWSGSLTIPDPDSWNTALYEARQKAILYNALLEESHLDHGMVVNLRVEGDIADECDSLLFSSLRYVALNKLGLIEEARNAWSAIQRAQILAGFARHPLCKDKATSRDMLIGVLAALTQRPESGRFYFQSILDSIEDNNGFITDGPVYVSYITPGIARMIRIVARQYGYSYEELPDYVREGYSTQEWTLVVTEPGYRAHLAALSVWIELEVQSQTDVPFNSFNQQNMEWITYKLVDLDPHNMFFRYLRLRVINAITPGVQYRLLKELQSMEQFPGYRLAYDCDRKADYLWQRSSDEYHRKKRYCTRQFAGVDLLWMTGLLTEGHKPTPLTH